MSFLSATSPVGNPDLRAEQAWQADVGGNLAMGGLAFEATFYKSWINNLIQWLPGGREISNGEVLNFWFPQNAREVEITGLSSRISYILEPIPDYHLEINAFYTYNRSVNLSGISAQDRSIGKQLPYVPFHKGGGEIKQTFGQHYLTLIYQRTGQRFTESTNEQSLPVFTLLDLRLGTELTLGKHKVGLGMSIDNLLNEDYQNYELRATPGIAYNLHLTYKIK
jgi:iron complex outermembrane receptor protein